jgi:hypothetical protein
MLGWRRRTSTSVVGLSGGGATFRPARRRTRLTGISPDSAGLLLAPQIETKET